MSTDILKTRLAIARARAAMEVIKAKKINGGAYNRHPAGTSKGGQFAPKGTNSFGNPDAPAPFKSGGNTFHEVGGPGWGHYAKPSAPPPGAKPHPAGVNDKGQPVTVNYPSKPSGKETWHDKGKTATFVPGGETPEKLNGVAMKSWTPPKEGWHAVGGNNERLEALFPFDRPAAGKSTGAGVLIVEPDGRIWLTKPTNEFGGYKQTYPKGTVESGLTMQQNAIKEAWEETGLKIKITGVLGDYDRTTSRARMYLAERVGGTPKDMGWESQAVRLATFKDAKSLLNMSHDKAILDDLEALLDITKAAGGKGGHWQNQARWPAGTPLGGQWKAMGADGITLPPLIAGGLEGKNATYQKFVNAAHAAAQAGDFKTLNAALDKYKEKFNGFMDGQKGSSHLKWGAQAHQYVVQAVVDAGTKPVAAATADRISGPEKLFSMMKTGEKPGGSNPGGMYVDKNGQQWLVKGSNAALSQDAKTIEDRSKNEVLAAKLMLAAGVGAPEMKLVDLEGQYNGGLGVASKWVDGLKKLSTTSASDLGAARTDFAVHAWLANYDALGMGLDNTMIKDGKAINIDTGGALLFRAQGAKKDLPGGLLDPSAPEFESMRSTTSEQKAVYGKMTQSDLLNSAEKLKAISDDTINSLVKTYGPGDEAFRDKLAQNLIDRKNAILAKVGMPVGGEVGVAAKPTGADLKAQYGGKQGITLPTGALAAAPIGLKGLGGTYTNQGIAALKNGDLAKLESLKSQFDEQLSSFKDVGMAGKMFPGHSKVKAFLTAAIAEVKAGGAPVPAATPAAPAPQPTKQEVEAKLVATAMKDVNAVTTAMKNKLANYPDYTVNGPAVSAAEAMAKAGSSATLAGIAEAMDKAYQAGDISGLAMAKVGATVMMKQSPDIKEKDDAATLVVFGTVGMNKLAFDAVKASMPIAEAAPKIVIPPKPVFPNNKTGSSYYNGLVEKAEKAAAAGDLAALKAVATNKYGKPAWPTDTANGKVMQAYHAGLVAQLEQKDAAVVVARVQQAAKALEEKTPPKPEADKPAAAVALPDFDAKKLPPTNKNAASANAKIDHIKELAQAGDVKGLLSLQYGTNTYGKQHAKLANDALAALGSPHVVAPGQKPNTHPALFGGVTAAQATAAAAKVNTTLPPNSDAPAQAAKAVKDAITGGEPWMKMNPGDKVVEQGEQFGVKWAKIQTPAKGFTPQDIPTPPDFFSNGSQGPGGTWKSTKKEINEANNAAVKLIHDTAVSGAGVEAVKALKFDVIDKSTGLPTGQKISIDKHPAAEVKEFHNQVTAELAAQLRPGFKSVQSGSFTGAYATAAEALAANHKQIAYDQFKNAAKAADYVVLSKDGASSLPVPQAGLFKEWNSSTKDHVDFKSASDAKFGKLTSSEKQAAKGYTGNKYIPWNEALRTGNTQSPAFSDAQPLVNAFKKAAADIPEGTILWRGINVGQATYESVVGGIIQDGSFNSASYGDKPAFSGHPTWLRIHVPKKGVKAIHATSFSGFGTGEREIIIQNGVRYAVLKVEHHKKFKTTGGEVFNSKTIVDVIALPHEP